jgi:serine/threonine-protein kinase
MAADDARRSKMAAEEFSEDRAVTKNQPSASHDFAEADKLGQLVDSSSQGLRRGDVPLSKDSDLTHAKTVIRGSSRVEVSSREDMARQGSPAAVARVLLGQHLNHFHLEELIGGGGMGAVFRAHDDQLDRIVAIKVIPFVGDDPELRRRFRNEAQNAAKLDHPKIARVFDVGSQGDWHYIVFEYIDGVNIRDLVSKQGVLSVDDAVFYTCQLGEALQHASDRGIVHRDIKPSNILVTTDAGIRLVDMGLARSASMDLSEDKTASGVTLGTFDYISPEQAKDPRDADLRSDLYSLGCTLYFMLTGGPPFPGGTMLQKLLSHGNTPPPDIQEIRADISSSLKSVVEKMLAKRPADRYQTAHDLLADLQEVANRDGLSRTLSLNPSLVLVSRPWLMLIERHAPWVIASSLMLLVAGFLQLQSWAYRADDRLPEMMAPQSVIPYSVTEEFGSEAAKLDLQRENDPANGLPPMSEPKLSENTSAGQGNIEDNSDSFGEVISPAVVRGRDSQGPIQSGNSATSTEQNSTDGNFNVTVPEIASSNEMLDRQVGLDVLPSSTSGLISEITVVRVVQALSDVDDKLSDGIVETTTLQEALELARLHRSTSRIELAVPFVVCTQPITLESDDLLITSSVGGTTILFQPSSSFVMARSKMFSIGSHPIVFEDLHFVWKVADDDLDGGCLFELNSNELVRFTDCSITVSNPSAIDEVFAFDVITDSDAMTSLNLESEDKLPLVWLELNNAIVRGQMTMLHMDFATKLWLDWDNGLLAVTDRMIDTSGALYPNQSGSDPIRMKLWRVTANARKGIFLMRVGVSGAYPVEIERLAHECVFWVDSALPHFDLRGMPVDSVGTSLKFQGASNVYLTDSAESDIMLRITAPPDFRQVVTMSQIANREVSWAADKSPRWKITWEDGNIQEIPFDQRVPSNYRILDSNPLGFDEKALPALPENIDFDGNAVQ